MSYKPHSLEMSPYVVKEVFVDMIKNHEIGEIIWVVLKIERH